ncbi:MAG: hypothetical protein V4548_13555 [Bacteroidota bacterium]
MIIRNLALIALLISTQFFFAQNSEEEIFNLNFSPNNDGGKLIVCRDKKQIEINFFGKKVDKLDMGTNEMLPNHFFINVDGIVFQTIIIPVPENIKKVYEMKKLTIKQQQEILKGYMSYEVNYMNNDKNTAVRDIMFAEGDINYKKYFIWNYFYKNYKPQDDTSGDLVAGQFCLSTLVFDQVLTVSVPMTKITMPNLIEKLKKIIENIKTHKQKCN